MKPALAVAVAVLALPAFAGCLADPSHATEAKALRDEVRALPGVAGATLKYSEPITLDSGKVVLEVRMDPGVGAEAIAQVVTTTYDAFAGVHHGEEGDLEVVLGEDAIHLRSFKPSAETESVERAATDAASVLGSGTVRAEIMTQDIAAEPHVETTYYVDIEQPGRGPLVQKLAELEREHDAIPHAIWRLQSGGDYGWLLMSSGHGFPDSDQRALFDQLSKPLPKGTAILMYDTDFVVAQVPADLAPDEASQMAARHLEVLGGVQKTFYDVQSGQNFSVMVADGECTFETDPIGVRLERDFGAECSKVTHPSDWD